MAKEDKEKTCCENNNFTIMNGFTFGFGFFLANLAGILTVGLVAWGFIILGRLVGWTI